MAERGQCVVVVESPAKAKTINKYLGKDFTVLASYGHVRDLPPKNGSVEPDRDFAMSWTVEGDSDKRLKAIAQAVKGAKALYLATDPDREGEAISWHIAEELKRRHAIDGLPVKRVTFNAITKSAVTEAFQNPRELDKDLIDAYLARRALDYLVGFTLSPVLWRKLPGSRSAGRVQSVALRLICQREAEIEIFRAEEYWTIDVSLRTPSGGSFQAHLSELKGKRLEKFDLPNEAAATAAADLLRNATRFDVASIEKKEVKRNPAPPFMTSSLQAEASRRLGFGASKTMKIAQKLYEGVELNGETVGLITYMRTDGVSLAGEALGQARRVIGEHFGDRYLPPAPRQYKTKAKNAQEAHEGIRPTDLGRRPEFIARHLEPDALKLYDLIWRRTLASQMASAELEQVGVDIGVDGNAAKLRATGQTVLFDGFLTLYQDQSTEAKDRDSDEESEDDRRLPKLERGDKLERQSVDPAQHFTQPPPRYSESGLIRKLEELGIGRPSTYTSILQVLQDRNYVKLDRRRFMPEDRGRIVTAFLENFFPRYVQYDFTADLEEQLDDISGGRKDYLTVLRDFWTAFKAAIDGTKELRISAVIDALDEALGPHFFPADSAQPGKDPRLCPSCGAGRLGLRLGKTGGFIGCSNYPDCRFTRTLALPGEGDADLAVGPRDLGEGPGGKKVTLRKGPFGFYVQLGEKDGDEKPKRASLPKGKNPSEITPAEALALLALPREVGRHPDGENIIAGIGRFGPYLKHGARYVNLKGDDDVLTIGLNRAVTVLAEAPAKKGKPQGKDLGAHPQSKQPIYLMAGRYGPYVKSGRTLVSLPKGTEAEGFSLEAAIALIDSKAKPGAKKKAAAKAPAEKPAAPKKSKTTKKPSAKAKKPAKKAG